MSSTNKTTNWGLPQWAASDPVEMADFNDSFSKIDESLGRRRLLDFTVEEETQMIQLDLSGIDLNKFFELEFHFQFQDKDIAVRLNNYSGTNYTQKQIGNPCVWDKMTFPPLTMNLIIGKSKYYAASEMIYWRYELPKNLSPNLKTVEIFYTDNTNFKLGERVTVWGIIR